MSQFEQENDLGSRGGEVDDETLERGRQNAEERRGDEALEDERETDARSVTEEERERRRETEETIDNPQPTAKFSTGRDPED